MCISIVSNSPYSFPKRTLRWGLSSGDTTYLPLAPNRNLLDDSYLLRSQPAEAHTAFLRRLVDQILVRWLPDLPDLFLRPCWSVITFCLYGSCSFAKKVCCATTNSDDIHICSACVHFRLTHTSNHCHITTFCGGKYQIQLVGKNARE